ncbi:acid phosphatase type 7-like [Rhodnius prolixus]|uniref:Purple acid phosphatase n=1 Tax=Rhodnius prolixus TaxID=13249 RepID=R4G3S3_RHOPR
MQPCIHLLVLLLSINLISGFVESDLKKKHRKKHHISKYQPEQIHIAFGENVDEMLITWSTFNATPNSIVEYGIDELTDKAEGYSKKFVDGGKEKRIQYIHRVRLTNLKPLTKYVYHCGSDLGWSEEFWFKTVNPSESWSPHLAVYGDLGNVNARSLPRLQEETQRHVYDAIIHAGDLAYDMKDKNGEVGDEFMRQIQPIAAYVPYMVCPGNHEEAYNFSHYRERFSMPGPYESLFYSFDLGPAHFISINTEAYYYLEYGLKLLTKQYYWLIEDLMKANLPENRQKRPWIITYGHKPMYCSNYYKDDCKLYSSRVRTGLPVMEWFGLEDLFYQHGVDLEIWAHEHSYERLWPIYNYQVKNGSLDQPYVNPGAPVHVITGSAGCQELTSNFTRHAKPWSAFRTLEYGYTRLHVLNASHLHIQQVAVDKGGEIIDDVWLIQNRHGPFKK